MKKIFLFMLILLFIPSVMAGPIAYGYIHINIVNRAPALEEVHLSNDVVYYDSLTDCLANVIDENPQEAVIDKKWFVNGEKVDDVVFNEGDEVTCVLTPVDEHGLEGADYTLTFKVKEASDDVKVAQKIFSVLGNKKKTEDLVFEKEKNLEAITGFVSGSNGKGPSFLLIILFIAGLIEIVTLRVGMHKKIWRRKNDI